MTAQRVLIVDDEPLARQRLRHLLAGIPGTQVVGECSDGTDAAKAIDEVAPDVVLLDVQMRQMDGFTLVNTVGVDRMPPVVFVTAHDQFALRAFDIHAVDYLLKPVERAELGRALERAAERRRPGNTGLPGDLRALLETVRIMLEESSGSTAGAAGASAGQRGIVTFANVVIDLRAHTVHRDGVPVALSPLAYALLEMLATRPDEVFTRPQLLKDIWGYPSDVATRTVDLHILELRRKLEVDPANPRHFHTVRKIGYRFTRG